MQKLVIANTGITDRGKTQALKKVIEDLLSNGAKEVKDKEAINGLYARCVRVMIDLRKVEMI